MLTGCREYRPGLIEMARGAAPAAERRRLLAHVGQCADCARVLDDQLALSAGLESLAGEPLPEMAEMEARVLAEFDRAHLHRRNRLRPVPAVAVLAAALAAVALIRLGVAGRHSTGPRQPAPIAARAPEKPVAVAASISLHPMRGRRMAAGMRRRVSPVRASKNQEEPFVQIPYTMPILPGEATKVLRLQVPVSALIAAGFQVAAPDPGATVSADVLVSQDGRARAIRLSSEEEER